MRDQLNEPSATPAALFSAWPRPQQHPPHSSYAPKSCRKCCTCENFRVVPGTDLPHSTWSPCRNCCHIATFRFGPAHGSWKPACDQLVVSFNGLLLFRRLCIGAAAVLVANASSTWRLSARDGGGQCEQLQRIVVFTSRRMSLHHSKQARSAVPHAPVRRCRRARPAPAGSVRFQRDDDREDHAEQSRNKA